MFMVFSKNLGLVPIFGFIQYIMFNMATSNLAS